MSADETILIHAFAPPARPEPGLVGDPGERMGHTIVGTSKRQVKSFVCNYLTRKSNGENILEGMFCKLLILREGVLRKSFIKNILQQVLRGEYFSGKCCIAALCFQ